MWRRIRKDILGESDTESSDEDADDESGSSDESSSDEEEDDEGGQAGGEGQEAGREVKPFQGQARPKQVVIKDMTEQDTVELRRNVRGGQGGGGQDCAVRPLGHRSLTPASSPPRSTSPSCPA